MRTKQGLAAARAKGKQAGRPKGSRDKERVLDDYEIPNGVWVTIGVYLWTDYQDIVAAARQTGYLQDDGELFTGAVYLSPGLPRSYLQELPEALRARPGYSVQFNKPNAAWTL